MAGKSAFSVTISAVDQASGALAAINKRMANVNATVAKAREPFDKLAANYGKFLQLTGADKIAGGLGRVARSGFSAFQAVTRIVEPLAAITGAASVAGMYRLATAWANFGTQLGNAANRAGLSAEQLHGLQNAARLAGSSAEALTGGMVTLKDNMVNAVAGKAPQFVSMIQALGLRMEDVARQTPTEQLRTFADRISALHNPTLEAEAATALFGSAGEQLLPFLRKGSAGIDEYNRKAERYGLMNQAGVDAANKLREAQTSLQLAVEGLGNSVAEKLAPVLTPLLKQMADWIARNRDWIATGIGDAVETFANYIRGVDWKRVGSDIDGVYHAVKGVADALGGWVPAGEAVLGFFAAAWLAKMTAPLMSILSLLLSLPKKAAVAAAEANLELGKIKPGGGPGGGGGGMLKGLGLGAMLGFLPDVLSGEAGARAARNLDERDRQALEPQPPDTRAWYERFYKPGPGLFAGAGGAPGSSDMPGDARHFAGPPPPAANANLAGRGHDANAARRDTSLPSGPNARGASPVSYQAPDLPAAAGGRGPQWGNDLKQLQGYGWSREQAAGILGNLAQESGGKEGAVGDGTSAYGLGQWHADRQANFAKVFGHDIRQGTHAEQVGFVNWELNNTERSAGNHLRATSDARSSAAAIRKYYERPANTTGQEDTWRGDLAEGILRSAPPVQLASAGPPAASGPSMSLPANAGTASNPGGGGVMPDGSVQVGIRLDGLPQNARTTATQSGQGMAPLRVERSNVGTSLAA